MLQQNITAQKKGMKNDYAILNSKYSNQPTHSNADPPSVFHAHKYTYITLIHMYIDIYTYIDKCVCVCVRAYAYLCVCGRAYIMHAYII